MEGTQTTFVQLTSATAFLTEGGCIPPELLTYILSFAVAPGSVVSNRPPLSASYSYHEAAPVIRLPKTRRYSALQLRLVCKYWYSLVTYEFLVTLHCTPFEQRNQADSDDTKQGIGPGTLDTLRVLQKAITTIFPNLQVLSLVIPHKLTLEQVAHFPLPSPPTTTNSSISGLRRFSCYIKSWEKGALLALQQHMDEHLRPWGLEDLILRTPGEDKDRDIEEMVEMVVGWERLPSSLTALTLECFRPDSFPLLADRFCACLRSLDLNFDSVEVEKLHQCFTLLKHFTRLELLKLSVPAKIYHIAPQTELVYVSTADLPSTLKCLHLNFVTMLITDGPPIPSSSLSSSLSSSSSSSAEYKVIPLPPQLEELHLERTSSRISHVLHHMLPTTLVTLQLSTDTVWRWDGRNITHGLGSEKGAPPNHELIKAALKAMPRLKYFALQWQNMLPPEELLSSLPSSLSWLLLQNQHLQNIHQLELPLAWYQLRKLTLTNVNLKDECIAALIGCTNLESLDLSNNAGLTGKTFNHLPSSLLALDIGWLQELCDEGIEHLANTTPQLRMLCLLLSKHITDACMPAIGCLTNLIELRLGACTNLTDNGMVHLQLLTKLEYLGLTSNKHCTSNMLQYLRSPCLLTLHCAGSCIDPKALKARMAELHQW